LTKKNSTFRSRAALVLAGCRNSGQRVLEIAVWGAEETSVAVAALENELPKLIHKQNSELSKNLN
jgi:hypothetical protein